MAAIAASQSSALAKTSVVSTESWQRDLKTLFDHAKERFPDVVWELTADYDTGAQEDVWGHKGGFLSSSRLIGCVQVLRSDGS